MPYTQLREKKERKKGSMKKFRLDQDSDLEGVIIPLTLAECFQVFFLQLLKFDRTARVSHRIKIIYGVLSFKSGTTHPTVIFS